MTTDPLERIAAALERLAPAPLAAPDFDKAEAFVWQVSPDRLQPVAMVNRIELALLIGIERARDTLMANTRQFAKGMPANNALLWGARGMGKSSIVKAVHETIREEGHDLKLIEVQREDLTSISRLLNVLRAAPYQFLLFVMTCHFPMTTSNTKASRLCWMGASKGGQTMLCFMRHPIAVI